jgi:DeoR family ulaG and ulaABCDEF operon transcriptional repressor
MPATARVLFNMLEKQRHQVILDFVDAHQFASVPALCALLESSEATIRRDLSKLAQAQQLRRIRGGVESLAAADLASQRAVDGAAFMVSKEQHVAAKRLIAQAAVALCADGESILINGGSSTYMMGEFLRNRRLNIFTNSFYLAQELITHSDNQVSMPAGEVYRRQGIVLSAFDQDGTQHYHGSKMFMGTPGIGEYGVMESDPLLINAEQKLRKQADRLIILADSSKIGQRSNLIFTPLSGVDVLITDDGITAEQREMFESHDVEVVCAATKPS